MLLSLIIFLEASFRRQLVRLVSSITVGLAIVSSLILFFQFFWDVVIAVTVLAGAYIMWENLRERLPAYTNAWNAVKAAN